jgi:hypothetical protein
VIQILSQLLITRHTRRVVHNDPPPTDDDDGPSPGRKPCRPVPGPEADA